MNLDIREISDVKIAEVTSSDLMIATVSDALDLMGNVSTKEITRIIVREHNLGQDFFDLKTGVAGEILQKFVTYGVQLAIVGDFSKYESKSLKDFIYECNNGRHIYFVVDMEEAIKKLSL